MKIIFLVAVCLICQVTSMNVKQTEYEADYNSLEGLQTIPEINKDLPNLIEGDIQLPEQYSRSTLNSENYGIYFWPNQAIPIVYGDDTTLLTKAAVDEARREYELRTCISLPMRTTEPDYITINVLGGCFSYIGRAGGNQVLSIGRGCEQMSIVAHEFMHALGFFHEQSRTDRNDYVTINYDAIDPNLAYNFDYYNYQVLDDRRVSYDFNSVMHYDKTAFSIDGSNTIITRDPAFQDLIGQTGGFSVGDVTKINRMYGCSDTLRVSNFVDFESEDAGGFSNYNIQADVDWIRHEVAKPKKKCPETMPNYDSTFSTPGRGSFLYMDMSRGKGGLTAKVKTRRYVTNVAKQCLEFSYYFALHPRSTAQLYVYLAELDENTGEIVSYEKIAWLSRLDAQDHPNYWRVHRMTISAPSSYRLVFSGRTGWYRNDVIAIDDLSIIDKECDTGYFLVPQYSNIIATYEPDEFLESPVMYTGYPGYAYQVLVYPNGLQAAADAGYTGFMSMYFRLVGGKFDDQLQWPFDQQFIRFLITDQGPNPLERLSHFFNFVTDASSFTDAWQKPAELGSKNDPLGFAIFFKTEEMFTRNYLKRNNAYFSVQVTDMRNYSDSESSAQFRNPVLRRSKTDTFMVGDPVELSANSKQQSRMAESGKDHPDTDDISQNNNAHEHSHDANDDIPPGMMTIKQGILSVFVTFAVVFVGMSILVCYVARSYKIKRITIPMGTSNEGFAGGSPQDIKVKYSHEGDKP